MAGRSSQQRRLVHAGGQLTSEYSPPPLPRGRQSGLARERREQRLAAPRVAQAHAPQVASSSPRAEVGERELAGISEPASSIAFADIRAQDSHDGGASSRGASPASGACSPSRCRARSGASPCSAPTRSPPELGVVVVLDDQPVAALGPLDQRRAARGAEHDARRELVRRRHDHRLGAARPSAAHSSMPWPSTGIGLTSRAGLLDDQPLGMPAWVLERDPLDPVGAQPAAGQREPLAKAGADQQLLGIGRRAADAAEVVRQRLAQLGDARGSP